ncbi:MAG: erythromycin esterase family protein [bacterium]|nr:erythromycin esterase family protein [bacterium]
MKIIFKGISILIILFFLNGFGITLKAETKKTAPPPVKLLPGQKIKKELKKGEIHSYSITLAKGEFLEAGVKEIESDVVVTVFAPDGKQVAMSDNAVPPLKREIIRLPATKPGDYRLAISIFNLMPTGGSYEVKIDKILSSTQYAALLKKEQLNRNAAIEWFAKNAIPLKTPEAGNGFEDLAPLKKIIGDSHLVALGESTHGTREIFQLKHRMLEFLVEEMGFTVFGIEGSSPEGFDINHYILTGEGDPEKALNGLYFWTWDTEEVLDMIKWMRKYNADPSHKKKVKFYGFDIGYAARAVKVVRNYLARVETGPEAKLKPELLALAGPFHDYYVYSRTPESLETLDHQAGALVRQFLDGKKKYSSETSLKEWDVAYYHARIIKQKVTLGRSKLGSSYRDQQMAENVSWILQHEGPGTKMAIWAHNGHVMTTSDTMGSCLRRMFGDDMTVFGFTFNRGSLQARPGAAIPLKHFTVGPAPAESVDGTLAAAGLTLAAINLRNQPTEGPAGEWFSRPHKSREIGALFRDDLESSLYYQCHLKKSFDALFFLENTTAAIANRGGKRPATPKPGNPMNLDFETGEPGTFPVHWRKPNVREKWQYNVSITGDNPHSGKQCAVISDLPGKRYGETAGYLRQDIDVTPYRGKKIKLTAAIKCDVKGPMNDVLFWIRPNRFGAHPYIIVGGDTAKKNTAGAKNTEWRIFEVLLEVPAKAPTMQFGLTLQGKGKAWLDSVSIEIVKDSANSKKTAQSQ